MDSIKLETFLITAKEGSFTRAATKLFITPAAVKKQIDSLEGEVGVALFYRSAAGCALTPPGEVFQKEARKVLRAVDRAVAATRQAQASQRSSLHVGHSVKLSYSFVSKLLAWGGARGGPLECRLDRMKKAELASALRSGTIDCFLYINPGRNDFKDIPGMLVGSARPYAVMRDGHPLEGPSPLALQDLVPYDLYVSAVLDGELFDALYALAPRSLHVLDAEDRNTVMFGLQHDAIVVYPSPVDHDRSVPLDYAPMDVRLYCLNETDTVDTFADHVASVLDEDGVIIM